VIHKIKARLSDNLDFVQAFVAIVQTIILAVMTVTIFQTQRTLSITQRQLESSIEPVLDMDMFGSTLQLVNSGSIEIRKLEELAIIAGDFDLDTKSISSYKVIRGRQTLYEAIEPGETLKLDLSQHIPAGLLPEKSAGIVHVYCLVLRYRRAADMKPFVQPMPFLVEKDTQTGTNDIYMPLFPSIASSEAGIAADGNKVDTARQELMKLYKAKMATEDF
jgi:hypothetical protein